MENFEIKGKKSNREMTESEIESFSLHLNLDALNNWFRFQFQLIWKLQLRKYKKKLSFPLSATLVVINLPQIESRSYCAIREETVMESRAVSATKIKFKLEEIKLSVRSSHRSSLLRLLLDWLHSTSKMYRRHVNWRTNKMNRSRSRILAKYCTGRHSGACDRRL